MHFVVEPGDDEFELPRVTIAPNKQPNRRTTSQPRIVPTSSAATSTSMNQLGCRFTGYGRLTDRPDQHNGLFEAQVPAGPPTNGENHAYRVRGGRYFLDVDASLRGDWTIIMSPRGLR